MEQKFDQFYMTIAQETGGIQGVFESMFSFLFRKTDYFYESDPGDKMGFPPGVNLKILYDNFQKYQNEHYKKYPKKDVNEYNRKFQEYKARQEQSNQNQFQKEIKKESLEQENTNPNNQPKKMDSKSIPVVRPESTCDIEVVEKEKKVLDINTYNGGETDTYKWSQTVTDVTFSLRLPQHSHSRDIKVEFKSNTIKVILKENIILNGELYDKIRADESFWTMEDNCLLVVSMEKGQENIWKTVIKGDKEIDATKVENSKHIHEFDESTQGALRKIMYEQDRKMKGLPTTEEEQQQQLLKQAWNSEGSPFKGTPFDPSKFQLGNN